MRYIGNKENILEKIYSILQANNIEGKTFFDFFAGTTNVGRFLRKKIIRFFLQIFYIYLIVCKKRILKIMKNLNSQNY